jgi:uncharacterized protein (DUF2267 family)
VGRERAELAIRATLQSLAERIASGEARDLAEELSDELAPLVATTSDAEHFDVDEFVRRLADRTGHSVEQARDDVRSLMVTLREALGDDEFFDVAVQLPREYDPVLAER